METIPEGELLAEYQRIHEYLARTPELTRLQDEMRGAVGRTPRDLVYREHSVSLHRYRRSTPARHRTPLLVVPSLVNRPWIMDLLPGESFVEAMLARGFDVFMLEWGEPNPAQRTMGLGEYLRRYMGRAVRRVRRATGAAGVSLAGYCLGGTFSLLYAALDKGESVRNLVTMVAPVGFEDRGMLSWWSQEQHFDVDRIVDTYGNIPAEFFSASFPWLVPTAKLKNLRLVYEKHRDLEFMRSFLALDNWISDQVPFPGEVYRDLIRHGYQRDCLVRDGAWPLDDTRAAMADVTLPVLALAAAHDHVAPAESCVRIADVVSSDDVTAAALPTGHLGIALGKTAAGKPTTEYWDTVGDWLGARDGGRA